MSTNELERDDSLPRVRYELSEDELTDLTTQLIAENPLQLTSSDRKRGIDTRFACYRVDSGSPYANIARHIEREVFEEKFGNDAEEMSAEYGPYDAPGVSTFFISVDRETSTATGALRMIRNSQAGFKTLNDLADSTKVDTPIDIEDAFAFHDIDDLDTCWDAATIAVRRGYRGMSSHAGLSTQLYRSAYLTAMEEGIDHVFMIMDERAREQSIKYLGVPYKPLAGQSSFSYLGSDNSYPMYGYYPEFYKKMTGIRRLTPHRLLARKAINRLTDNLHDSLLRIGDYK